MGFSEDKLIFLLAVIGAFSDCHFRGWREGMREGVWQSSGIECRQLALRRLLALHPSLQFPLQCSSQAQFYSKSVISTLLNGPTPFPGRYSAPDYASKGVFAGFILDSR